MPRLQFDRSREPQRSGKESEIFFIDLKFDLLAAIFRYSAKSVFIVVNEKADAA